MATIETKDLLTSTQAGELLGVSADTIKKYCQWGKLKAMKMGRDWLISRSEVSRYQADRVPPGRPARDS